MLQSIEVSDSEIPSTVGYIPQKVEVIDAQLEGGIIPRTTMYIIKSMCIRNEGDIMSMSSMIIYVRLFISAQIQKENILSLRGTYLIANNHYVIYCNLSLICDLFYPSNVTTIYNHK